MVRSCACVQDAQPLAVDGKKPCGGGRKTSKAKSAPATVPTKDPQSLAAKVIN